MTNFAVLLCLAGSSVGIQPESDGLDPRTTGRPMDGTVVARTIVDSADVVIRFEQKPPASSSQQSQPVPELPEGPPKPIRFADKPSGPNQFCFVVVNRNLLKGPIKSPSDLRSVDRNWAASVRAYDNLTKLTEIRYLAPILGASRVQRLRLYIFLAEDRKGELYWKLESQGDALFD